MSEPKYLTTREWMWLALNDKERESYDKFMEHDKTHWDEYNQKRKAFIDINVRGKDNGLRVPGGIDGSSFSMRITPGGIGTVYVMHCNVCKYESNITDFDCW